MILIQIKLLYDKRKENNDKKVMSEKNIKINNNYISKDLI